MSTHKMVTRSKGTSRKKKKNIPPNQDLDDLDDVDTHGNLKGLIDYDCEDEIDFDDLKDTISRFKRGNNITISTVEFDSESDEEYVPVKKKKNQSQKKIQMVVDEEPEDVKTQNPGDLLMGYLVKRANEEMQRREKKRKRMKELKNEKDNS